MNAPPPNLNFTCILREHSNGEFSVRVVVGMFTAREVAVQFSDWMREVLQENEDEIEQFIVPEVEGSESIN